MVSPEPSSQASQPDPTDQAERHPRPDRAAGAADASARELEDWFAFARIDADRRNLPALKPLLPGLEAALRELRAADWNDDFRAEPIVRRDLPAGDEAPARA